ncbi:hypothetical protein [Undibacterium oligocarboniphilum]|uniref:Uncharacterized protein n=1 Tax=Undibacterium oligocarboniphilum TaxID=666702 RepID=A0A850QSL1_9BURK|nr:hypothetical protein [Undibacterium oligocarboniphilum]MBC3871398.1 hypothetical protein [Undibacterium oligocarboniphilum]NVO79026.1 hypothetical protein [Undibacterium oligocarboniphilum]
MNTGSDINPVIKLEKRKRGRPTLTPGHSKAKSDAQRAKEYRLRQKNRQVTKPNPNNSWPQPASECLFDLQKDLAIMSDMLGQLIDQKRGKIRMPADVFSKICLKHFEITLKHDFL